MVLAFVEAVPALFQLHFRIMSLTSEFVLKNYINHDAVSWIRKWRQGKRGK